MSSHIVQRAIWPQIEMTSVLGSVLLQAGDLPRPSVHRLNNRERLNYQDANDVARFVRCSKLLHDLSYCLIHEPPSKLDARHDTTRTR